MMLEQWTVRSWIFFIYIIIMGLSVVTLLLIMAFKGMPEGGCDNKPLDRRTENILFGCYILFSVMMATGAIMSEFGANRFTEIEPAFKLLRFYQQYGVMKW